MGCSSSKPGVVPVYDEREETGNQAEPAVAPTADGSSNGHKSMRMGLQKSPSSKRQIDRKDNKSFYNKSRSNKGFNSGSQNKSSGNKSTRRVSAFSDRIPNRLDAPLETEDKSNGTKSRFAKSIKAVTDAVFGPPPEWILRQTISIKSNYQFLGVVGRGQFGQVYCIRHLRHGHKFACKTLGKKKLLSQLDAEDIKREIEVMHHLSGHATVVSLHRVFEDEKNVHLVMDLCQGDLYELLRECKYLPEDKAAPLMMQALRAVQYCHSMGVVHRDIKPENFLLANRGDLSHIKLTDFGLSTFFQEGQVFNELLGSPYYIAPEVIRQKYGKEADVWSCGVMLYIMLCGEAPFFGEGDEGIFKSIMKAKLDFSFEPWPSLSRDVKMLLRRMLVKDPRERASLEEILEHPWFQRYAAAPLGKDSLGLTAAAQTVPAARTGAPATLPPLPHSPSRSGLGGSENTLFSRLKRYSVASRTKKAALRYIVASLPDEVTAGLYNLFQDFDQDANNAIDPAEFKDGFMRRGVVLLDEEAASLVGSADLDGDGVLNLVEWLGATIYLPEDQVDPLVAEAFAFMDTDHNGYLSRQELVAYLGEGHAELADLIIAEADTDMDGRISAEEFHVAYAMTLERSRAASRPNTAPYSGSRSRDSGGASLGVRGSGGGGGLVAAAAAAVMNGGGGSMHGSAHGGSVHRGSGAGGAPGSAQLSVRNTAHQQQGGAASPYGNGYGTPGSAHGAPATPPGHYGGGGGGAGAMAEAAGGMGRGLVSAPGPIAAAAMGQGHYASSQQQQPHHTYPQAQLVQQQQQYYQHPGAQQYSSQPQQPQGVAGGGGGGAQLRLGGGDAFGGTGAGVVMRMTSVTSCVSAGDELARRSLLLNEDSSFPPLADPYV